MSIYRSEELQEKKMSEKYLLIAVSSGDEDAAWTSLEELMALLETAGGEAVEGFVQNLPHPDPATYIGSGKAAEMRDLVGLAL